MRVDDVDELDLSLHDRSGAGGVEASQGAGDPGAVAGGRDDGGLLGDHGRERVLAVHGEVGGHPDGQCEGAEHVLAQMARSLGVEAVRVEGREFGDVDPHRLGDDLAPLADAQSAEARNSAGHE